MVKTMWPQGEPETPTQHPGQDKQRPQSESDRFNAAGGRSRKGGKDEIRFTEDHEKGVGAFSQASDQLRGMPSPGMDEREGRTGEREPDQDSEGSRRYHRRNRYMVRLEKSRIRSDPR